MDINSLERFVKAQENTYETALNEIKNGKKETHWMWFIFPQLRGLGTSSISRYYGLEGIEEGVKSNAVTVGHLSDTDDLEYVKSIASYGCYIGLDRMYGNVSETYVSKKVQSILELYKAGYEDQILLSHDAQFFNGFEAEPKMYEQPRFSYCFDYILSQLPKSLSEKLTVQNPVRMLTCK